MRSSARHSLPAHSPAGRGPREALLPARTRFPEPSGHPCIRLCTWRPLAGNKAHDPRTFHVNPDKLGLFIGIPTGQTKTLGLMEQKAAFLIAALVASRAQGAETMNPQ